MFIQTTSLSQNLDVDELLERLDRIEKNISDIQKGKIEKLERTHSHQDIYQETKRNWVILRQKLEQTSDWLKR